MLYERMKRLSIKFFFFLDRAWASSVPVFSDPTISEQNLDQHGGETSLLYVSYLELG